jgi:hypothetical protein
MGNDSGLRHHEESRVMNEDRKRRMQDDAEMYRRAAEAALDQLEQCISYLHRIRKSRIAADLDRNRKTIRRQMRGTG